MQRRQPLALCLAQSPSFLSDRPMRSTTPPSAELISHLFLPAALLVVSRAVSLSASHDTAMTHESAVRKLDSPSDTPAIGI